MWIIHVRRHTTQIELVDRRRRWRVCIGLGRTVLMLLLLLLMLLVVPFHLVLLLLGRHYLTQHVVLAFGFGFGFILEKLRQDGTSVFVMLIRFLFAVGV